MLQIIGRAVYLVSVQIILKLSLYESSEIAYWGFLRIIFSVHGGEAIYSDSYLFL